MNRDGKPTIYDVAEQAGVSIGTVSRVLNDRGEVAAATRAHVLEVARQLGYMPKLTARRVTIGLVLRDTTAVHEVGYMGRLICQLAHYTALREVSLEIIPIEHVDRIFRHYVRGLIGVLFDDSPRKLIDIGQVPVVLINNLQKDLPFHAVVSDHAEGARIATRHLIEHGHRRIIFLEILENNWGAEERERGYREAFAEAELTPPEDLIAYLNSQPIEEVFDPLIAKEATAVLACGEDLSFAVTDALTHRLKMRIPEDISIVGYEIPLMSKVLSPPQTTVTQPWDQLAKAAVDIVLSAIDPNDDQQLRRVVLPNRLIRRHSVRDLS